MSSRTGSGLESSSGNTGRRGWPASSMRKPSPFYAPCATSCRCAVDNAFTHSSASRACSRMARRFSHASFRRGKPSPSSKVAKGRSSSMVPVCSRPGMQGWRRVANCRMRSRMRRFTESDTASDAISIRTRCWKSCVLSAIHPPPGADSTTRKGWIRSPIATDLMATVDWEIREKSRVSEWLVWGVAKNLWLRWSGRRDSNPI